MRASSGVSRNARAVELMVQRDFLYSLMMLCYCVLHVLKHFLHWNCCVEDMWSHLQLLKFEGSLARKLRFHIFNSWNLTEASHESFVFVSQILEFDRSLARKRHFDILNLSKLTEASHESSVFIHHGCHLNVRICTKPLYFFGSTELWAR